jgi:photosystem II stability/assembly factor-like uncharacterized protein
MVGRNVFVWDDDHAWVVTSPTTVALTTDGGATWGVRSLPIKCSQWVGVTFSDLQHGHLVCLDPLHDSTPTTDTVLATSDGGKTWLVSAIRATTAHGWFGTDIVSSGLADIFAAAISQDTGDQTQLAQSSNGGLLWTSVGLPGLASVYHGGGSIQPLGPPTILDGGILFAVSDSSHPTNPVRIWTSMQSQPWAEVTMGGSAPSAPVAFVSTQHWFARGHGGVGIVETTDAGRDWSAVSARGLPDGATYFLGFLNGKSGAAVVDAPRISSDLFQVMYVTGDAGRSWVPATLPER